MNQDTLIAIMAAIIWSQGRVENSTRAVVEARYLWKIAHRDAVKPIVYEGEEDGA